MLTSQDQLLKSKLLYTCNAVISNFMHSVFLIVSFFLCQRVINREKQRSTRMRLSREKILHECRLLRERLQECSAKFLAEEQDNFTIDPSSLPDALDLLATSDNRIRLLVAEVKFKCCDRLMSSITCFKCYGRLMSFITWACLAKF